MNIQYVAIAKEWYDKVNNNFYFSVQIKNLKNGDILYLPIQYGSDDHYKWEVKKALNLKGYNSKLPIEFFKSVNCLKKDVKAWGMK